MAIKKYVANADTTITNAFQPNLNTRATGANAGASDVLETFSIYGRQASSSAELSRILIKFPIDQITTDRNNGVIPGSGSVSFYLRMFNAKHSKTVPSGSYLMVAEPLSRDWQEGFGLDLETYKDKTNGNVGSNWMSASATTPWTKTGGDYITAANAAYPWRWFSQRMTTGLEDIEIDITQMVELWSAGTVNNYGFGVHLTGAAEAYYDVAQDGTYDGWNQNTTGSTTSFYTKRFFARGTQYFYKKPVIEARWNSSRKDDRGDMFYSSSLAGVNDNLNTIFLYNYVRGRLSNIPSVNKGAIYVSFYSGSNDDSKSSGHSKATGTETGREDRMAITLPTTLPYTHVSALNPYVVTGGWISTGIYTASFAITGATPPLTKIFDVWHDGSGKNRPWSGIEFATSSFRPLNMSASVSVNKPFYFLNITNLRNSYDAAETARFNLFVRPKYWNPTVYTIANADVENTSQASASYMVYRVLDGHAAVPYGTGSNGETMLSYDMSGNYFDFDMRLLEPGYTYAFKFSFYDNDIGSWTEQKDSFKFRVEDYEY